MNYTMHDYFASLPVLLLIFTSCCYYICMTNVNRILFTFFDVSVFLEFSLKL